MVKILIKIPVKSKNAQLLWCCIPLRNLPDPLCTYKVCTGREDFWILSGTEWSEFLSPPWSWAACRARPSCPDCRRSRRASGDSPLSPAAHEQAVSYVTTTTLTSEHHHQVKHKFYWVPSNILDSKWWAVLVWHLNVIYVQHFKNEKKTWKLKWSR